MVGAGRSQHRVSTPAGRTSPSPTARSRFIKDSIATWQNDLNNFGDPIGVSYGPSSEYRFGASKPQIYQFLSTRNGGEVISGDTY